MEKINEERFNILEQLVFELLERCKLQSSQIVDLKEKYISLLVEVEILKEGGNI